MWASVSELYVEVQGVLFKKTSSCVFLVRVLRADSRSIVGLSAYRALKTYLYEAPFFLLNGQCEVFVNIRVDVFSPVGT